MTAPPGGHQADVVGSATSHESANAGSSTGLRDLQLVELDIFREFVRLCNASGLRYYLAYGTLLGAVRHRGFIPWDDDIDVTMPREDYERFVRLCVSELRPGFRWQSYVTDDQYPVWFGKLIKSDTLLRQASAQHLALQQSVFVDVFPLDGLAAGRMQAVLQRVIVRLARLRLGAGLRRSPFKGRLVQVTRLLPRRLVIALGEWVIRRYPAGASARWICFGGPYAYSRQSFPSKWFGTGAALAFEGLSVIGPAEWDRYLGQLYGAYMTLPPPDQRVSHHGVTEVVLGPVRAAEHVVSASQAAAAKARIRDIGEVGGGQPTIGHR